MNMHDNDMDKLFRSKLEDFEVEPSASVWANISNQLGGQPKRKSYVPLLRVAASVAVLVTAGMIFLTNKKDDDIVKPGIKVALNPKIQTPAIVQPATTSVRSIAPLVNAQAVASVKPKQIVRVANNPVTNTDQTGTQNTQTAIDQTKPEIVIDTQPANIMATASTTKAVVPDITLKADDTAPASKAVLAANDPSTMDNPTSAPIKKRKVRGLGGLINAVVGAVDKREDKIIEFTDTDEGDTVTGINLGLFKVKKQK